MEPDQPETTDDDFLWWIRPTKLVWILHHKLRILTRRNYKSSSFWRDWDYCRWLEVECWVSVYAGDIGGPEETSHETEWNIPESFLFSL